MTFELRELYQQTILDHNRAPRNFRVVEGANRVAEGYNPLCGDKLKVSLRVDDADVIEDVGFVGSGCAISKAAASLMTEAVLGKTTKQVEDIFEDFHRMVTDAGDEPDRKKLGKLLALSGVKQFPARVKCASLPWHTLKAAIESATVPVSTE